LEEGFLDELLTLDEAFVDERLTVDRVVFDMTVPDANRCWRKGDHRLMDGNVNIRRDRISNALRLR